MRTTLLALALVLVGCGGDVETTGAEPSEDAQCEGVNVDTCEDANDPCAIFRCAGGQCVKIDSACD